MTGRILIIEDEHDIVQLLEYNLHREGFEVTAVHSGEDGLQAASSYPPDLILLDLMLPGLDGLDVCKKLKADNTTAPIPVIMLTAKAEEADVVTGLEVGADDYIVKPFSPRVLIARVRAVLRRRVSDDKRPSVIQAAGLRIDEDRHEVSADNRKIELTLTEFQILYCLARRPGWVFSRSQIIDEIRGGETIITDRAIDVQIVALRKKLGDRGEIIETVRGVGYRFREM